MTVFILLRFLESLEPPPRRSLESPVPIRRHFLHRHFLTFPQPSVWCLICRGDICYLKSVPPFEICGEIFTKNLGRITDKSWSRSTRSKFKTNKAKLQNVQNETNLTKLSKNRPQPRHHDWHEREDAESIPSRRCGCSTSPRTQESYQAAGQGVNVYNGVQLQSTPVLSRQSFIWIEGMTRNFTSNPFSCIYLLSRIYKCNQRFSETTLYSTTWVCTT